jgi:hypothetical protein
VQDLVSQILKSAECPLLRVPNRQTRRRSCGRRRRSRRRRSTPTGSARCNMELTLSIFNNSYSTSRIVDHHKKEHPEEHPDLHARLCQEQ